MKKRTLLFLALCSLIFLTACGTLKDEKKETTKTLTCSQDMSDELEGLGTWTSQIKFIYQDDKMNSANLKMVINIENKEITEDQMKIFEDSLKSECSSTDYSSCDVSRAGNTVTFLASGSAEIAGSDYSDKLTFDEAKSMLETDGFTCE